MSSNQLTSYINRSRKSGKTDNEIRQELLDLGWQGDDIEESLKILPVSKNLYKFLVLILVVTVIATASCFFSFGHFNFWSFSSFGLTNENTINTLTEEYISKEVTGWKTHRFRSCGFEFKLPQDWDIIKNSKIQSNREITMLTLAPTRDWYFKNQLLIFFDENPDNLPYEKLFLPYGPEYAKEYYSDKSSIFIDGVSAKVVHDLPGEIYSNRIIYISRDKYFLSILEPRHPVINFDQFIKEFKLNDRVSVDSCKEEIKQKEVSKENECPPSDSVCLGNKAVAENNPSICLNAGSVGYSSDECFVQMATVSGDQLYCENIKEKTYQESCYEKVATKTKNPPLCQKINSDYSKKSCYIRAYTSLAQDKLDPKFCNKSEEYSNSSEYLPSSSICYRNVAIKSGNIKICDMINPTDDIKFCYRDFAEYKNNCSLLQTTRYSNLEDDCKKDLDNGMKIIVE